MLPQGTANVYFEAAAVIVTLILLDACWRRAAGRTSQAIKRLVGLQPKVARVERHGETVEIPLEQVVAGDVVFVRPGRKSRWMAKFWKARLMSMKSMITGEPVPVEKTVGADVVGGTINKTGAFSFRATKVGANTVLAQSFDWWRKRRVPNCRFRRWSIR